MLAEVEDPSVSDTAYIRAGVLAADGSKFVTYKDDINNSLEFHPMYTPISNVSENDRMIVTCLRLSSHNLAIETGRWNGTPREERLCACGCVQTETHILCQCILSSHIREQYTNIDFSSASSVFSSNNVRFMCQAVNRIYTVYNAD